jgi:FkbM family methyltransferase
MVSVVRAVLGPARSKVRNARGQLSARRMRRRRKVFYGQFLGTHSLAFDVGANEGNRVEAFVALGARVVAVEPLAECADALASRFGGACIVVREGLAAHEGTATLRTTSASTIASMSDDFIRETRASGRFSQYEWADAREVPVTTLDALIERFGTPDFIKIDVEGFEVEILRGLSSEVPALSFEYTAELSQLARDCVSRIEQIGSYEFAYSAQETMTITMPWTTGDAVLTGLQASSDPLEWGDIYARRL